MAAKTITVNVLSPEETLFSGVAEAVFIPGSVAPFEVLPGHAPIIATLSPGDLVVRDEKGKEHGIPVASGVVKVSHDKLTACVEVNKK
mgnify:CR=1 FL=1